MKKISIENFRIFKEETEFELKPINILVGPNNAGKSSFTKLLQLLSNNLERLDFSKGEHNLKDFNSILPWGSQNKEMTVTIQIDDLWSLKVQYGGEHLIQLKYDLDVIGEVYCNSIQVDFSEEWGPTYVPYYNFKFYLNSVLKNIKKIVLNGEERIYDKMYDADAAQKVVEEFLDNFDNDYGINTSLYGVKHDIDQELLVFHKSEDIYSYQYDVQTIDHSIRGLLDQIRDIKLSVILSEISKNIANKLEIVEVDITLHKEIVKIFDNMFLVSYPQYESIWSMLLPQTTDFNFLVETINTQRGNHNQLIFHDKSNFYKNLELSNPFIPFTLRKGQKDKDKNDENKYVFPAKNELLEKPKPRTYNSSLFGFYKINTFHTEILKVLEIEGAIQIERDKYNIYSVVDLIVNDKKINISDMGYGYSQLLPLLFKLFTILDINDMSKKDNRIIIIEEPEANLHPNLQSKIADVLAITIKHFPNIKIIVETHSEYLIRKLQFLTAKKEIPLNDSVIYYFNADKNVSEHEPKVKKIEIKSNGQLTDSFGSGFFDEITNIQFALSQLNKYSGN